MLIKKKFYSNGFLQKTVRLWLEDSLPHLSADEFFVLALVTNEIIQNILRYVYQGEEGKPILLTINVSDIKRLEVCIQDYGAPCHPQRFLNQNHQPSEKGGMGLAIVKKNTLDFTITENAEGNLASFAFIPSSVKE